MSDHPQQIQSWRTPQQARSRERFHRILDAAADLFMEVGYDSVTTDEIAARANTSVGGLYRFFPDKLAVFQALLDRYFNQFRELFAALTNEETIHLPLDTYIHQVIDGFDRFVTANPAFRVVFVQSRLLSKTVEMNAVFNQEIASQLAIFFAARNPALTLSQRELLAIISVEAASALEILSLSGDRNFRHQILSETKKLLVAYLSQYLSH